MKLKRNTCIRNKVFFFSHAEEDREIVAKLAHYIGEDKVWLYEQEVKPGDSVFKSDKAISKCRIFVLFWSQNACRSKWVKEEIDQARLRLLCGGRLRFVTIRLDGTPLPSGLAFRDYLDFATEGLEYVARRLESISAECSDHSNLN
jgi:hypothetical protein